MTVRTLSTLFVIAAILAFSPAGNAVYMAGGEASTECSEGFADARAAGTNPSTSASVANQNSGYSTPTMSWASGTGSSSASASAGGVSSDCASG